ncbi:MAG: hypothetical protein JOZ11_00410 [Alphaproteobacteria bacterium]|nr:hypothetical protein [Alphaproteobacteria bacterium]
MVETPAARAPLNRDSGARLSRDSHGSSPWAEGPRRAPAGAQRVVHGDTERGAQQPGDPRVPPSAVGTPAKVALVAFMRKMVVVLNGGVRDHLAAAAIP